MKHYCMTKQTLQGEITVPSSKSQTLRGICFGAMGRKKTVIHDPLFSGDTDAMIRAVCNIGAECNVHSDCIEIQGVGGKISFAEDVINAQNSGIVYRFCTAIGSLSSFPIVITGDHSIRHRRPIKPLLDGLCQLGVKAESLKRDDYAPILVQGPLHQGKAVIHGEDSQPVSSLLIACSFVDGPCELEVKNPGEKPWVALTLNWLDRLNISYTNDNFTRFTLQGSASYDGFEYKVPGDLSSCAFPVAAAIVTNSELIVRNVDMRDLQGDKALIHLFQKMGGNIEIDEENKAIIVKKGSVLHGVTVDINNFVDAICILSVVSCFAEGTTHIQNAKIARQKESNRIESIVTELQKMGANIHSTEDGITISKSLLKGAPVFSYNDHRMAMSLAVAALGAQGQTHISSTECIAKTYPTFVSDFNRIGANIKETL